MSVGSLLVGALIGTVFTNFLLIPGIEYWKEWRHQRNVATIRKFCRDHDNLHRRIIESYEDECEKLMKEQSCDTRN
jgi:hypothetical protein